MKGAAAAAVTDALIARLEVGRIAKSEARFLHQLARSFQDDSCYVIKSVKHQYSLIALE